MAGKSTVFQRLRMNQEGLGFNDTERLRMRESIIRRLIDVFLKAKWHCIFPEPIHNLQVCSQDSGPICYRTEEYCADTTSISKRWPTIAATSSVSGMMNAMLLCKVSGQTLRCDVQLNMGKTLHLMQMPSSKIHTH